MQFSLDNYGDFVLELLAGGYACRSFKNVEAAASGGRQLFLRHDVDMDPCAALPMARLEAGIGAASTYFLLLSNRHTNPMDISFRRAVDEIVNLGHWVGLHFDASQYGLTAESSDFSKKVEFECRLFRLMFETDVESISFHRPTRDLINSPQSITGSWTHTYQETFVQNMEYCSDSSGRWAYGPPQDRAAILNGEPFHFLTHPISWSNDTLSPQERIVNWINRRAHDDVEYEVPGWYQG